MSQHGLFIPGLFVSPLSKKYYLLQKALAPCSLDFLDFKKFYESELDFFAMADYVASEVKKYDFIVAQCLGFSMYHQAVAKDATCEREKALFITPPCDFYNSGWMKSLTPEEKAGAIPFAPNCYYPQSGQISYRFYRDLADNWNNVKVTFSQNSEAILATNDFYVSKNVKENLSSIGVKNTIDIVDDHAIRNTLPQICTIAQKFIL